MNVRKLTSDAKHFILYITVLRMWHSVICYELRRKDEIIHNDTGSEVLVFSWAKLC